MSRITLLVAAGLAIVLTAPRIASAQYRGGSDNPNGSTVSPYLNLLNTQSNLGLPAYQTMVRPQIEQQNAIQRQGNSIQRLQQQVNSAGPRSGGGSAATGHTTFFMNYSHYYAKRPR